MNRMMRVVMPLAGLLLPALLTWGRLHAGEEISPMRGSAVLARAWSGGRPERPANEPPTQEDPGRQASQAKEFVRITFPSAVAEAPGRPRIVIVDDQPGGVIDFTPRSPRMPADEIDIPGLITPDVLALDKFTLHGDGRRPRSVTLPPEAKSPAPFDAAPEDWRGKARAFPGFSDRMPEIAAHEQLLPTVLPAPYSLQAESLLISAEAGPIPPAWDITALPRGEVRGIDPPSAFPALPLPSLPALPMDLK